MDLKLCPSASAALISGQSAQIWPALVSGFFARRCARRFRVSGIQLSANNTPHIPREWERDFGTRNRRNIFVGETIRGGSKQSATDRDSFRGARQSATVARQLATKGNNR